jgi:hypothetical protein
MQQLNDEAMRYELLRRQQERLRTHMQGLQQYAPAPPEAAAGGSDQSVPLVSSLQVRMQTCTAAKVLYMPCLGVLSLRFRILYVLSSS